ncbi:hypothetical protein ABZX40_28380 [Streptomyces sp. NPDC004610]|uniref:hypothetical protein n=1 Tax=unclassified Streptomyces TaxID=2593676 RepID=UPI0033A9E650
MPPNPYENLLTRQSLTPAARTASADGSAVDRAAGGARFQDAVVVVTTGTITDGTHTIVVAESSDGTTFTAVADADLQGPEPAIVAADDNKVFEIGYRGGARWLRVSVTVAGATTGGVYGAAVVLANPRRAAVSHS